MLASRSWSSIRFCAWQHSHYPTLATFLWSLFHINLPLPPFKVSQCIAMAQTTIQLRAIKTDYGGELCAHLLNWLSWWMLSLWIDWDQLTCTSHHWWGVAGYYSLSKAKRPKGPPARSRGLEGPKTSSLS